MKEINTKNIYTISNDLISREIEDCLVIVPLDSGIGKLDEDVYSLNETGQEVWGLIDGKRSLDTIIHDLAKKYDSNLEMLKNDVVELISDFLDKGLISEIKKNTID